MTDRKWTFDHFAYVSSPTLNPEEMTTDTITLFTYFNWLRKEHSIDWITSESITEDEKEIIRVHLTMFAANFLRCDMSNFRYCERKSLSGMDLFRLEILPIFRKFIDADFNWVECYYLDPIKTEARANQRWWDNDYKESDDRIHLLNEEYNLTD